MRLRRRISRPVKGGRASKPQLKSKKLLILGMALIMFGLIAAVYKYDHKAASSQSSDAKIEDMVSRAAKWAQDLRRKRIAKKKTHSPSNAELPVVSPSLHQKVISKDNVPPVISGYDILYEPGFLSRIQEALKPECSFEDAKPGFLGGCTSDQCKGYPTLDSAKAKCLELGRECGGVTESGDGTFQTRKGNNIQRSSQSNSQHETSHKVKCEFIQTSPPPEFQPEAGVDIDDIGTKVNGKPTIFVSVASYRDSRCTGTLESLFNRAEFPERVFVGVVQQNSPISGDKECMETSIPCAQNPNQVLCKYAKQIRVHMVQSEESYGPTFGRHRADRLYRGEYYAMQIDAHSVMLKHWDSEGIAQHTASGNQYAVMTNYPSHVDAISADGKAKWSTTPIMCNSHFEGEVLRFDSNLEVKVPNRYQGSPILQPFWGAGASFSRGHRIVRVPYDCCLDMIFTGEEISMAARMWTNGYDMYTFHHSIVYHQYGSAPGQKRTPLFWENSSRRDSRKAINRVKLLFGIPQPEGSYHTKDLKKYGLGNRRPLSKYLALFGIDFRRRKVAKNCPIVTSFKLHDHMTARMRPDGKGINYDQIPGDLFHKH